MIRYNFLHSPLLLVVSGSAYIATCIWDSQESSDTIFICLPRSAGHVCQLFPQSEAYTVVRLGVHFFFCFVYGRHRSIRDCAPKVNVARPIAAEHLVSILQLLPHSHKAVLLVSADDSIDVDVAVRMLFPEHHHLIHFVVCSIEDLLMDGDKQISKLCTRVFNRLP